MTLTGEVDLNADLGEEVTDDDGLLALVTSANVACGYHAGSHDLMRRVCDEAARLGVKVGAQVSYADREHFGRAARDVPYAVLREQVADQVGTLSSIAVEAGIAVSYLKPHGALYHRVVDDEAQARAVLDGSGALAVLGLPGALVLDLGRGRRAAYPHGGLPRPRVRRPRRPGAAHRAGGGARRRGPDRGAGGGPGDTGRVGLRAR